MKTNIETKETESLHGRAMDNLEFIRETMSRSATFTAVPGYGGVLMGITAIAAATISEVYFGGINLLVWIGEAVLAFLIGSLAMWQKSQSTDESLLSAPAKKFVTGFAPPLIVAVIFTAVLAFNGLHRFLPVVWLGLYGASVVTGGAYSVRAVPIMGWGFIALSLFAGFLPGYGNILMAVGFGGLHMIFGVIIGRKYGG